MSEFRRQHPIVAVVRSLEQLKELLTYALGIFLAGYFFGEEPPSSMGALRTVQILGGLILCTLIYGIVHWTFFKYKQETSGTLVIKRGMIFRKQSSFSKEKIQSIELSTSVLQRCFGFVTIKVETAAGEKEPEFGLPMIKQAEAEMIRQRLIQVTNEVRADIQFMDNVFTEAKVSTRLYSLNWKNLMLSGAFRLPVRAILITYALIVQFAPSTVKIQAMEWFSKFYRDSDALLATEAALLLLIMCWVASIVYEIIHYHGFVMAKQAEDITVSFGLFSKRFFQLHSSRIQFVTLSQNPISRALGIGQLSVHIATAAAGKVGDQVVVIAPFIVRSKINALLATIDDNLQFPEQVHPLPIKAQLGYIVWAIFTGLILIALPYYLGFLSHQASLVLMLIFALIGRLRWINGAFYTNEKIFVLRNGAWNVTTHLFQIRKIVLCRIKQSLLQRRRKICSLQVLNAGSNTALSLKGMSDQHAENCLELLVTSSAIKLPAHDHDA